MPEEPAPDPNHTSTLTNSAPAGQTGPVSDEVAYILPMAAFLGLTAVGNSWPAFYPHSYVAKTLVTAGLLWWLRRSYTKIQWSHLWLGALVGVLVTVQWIGMEKLLAPYLSLGELLGKIPLVGGILGSGPAEPADPFNPYEAFSSMGVMWAFIAVRWAGASLVVPVMEELFWRDFLWRMLIDGDAFKKIQVGVWSTFAFTIVTLLFATVHTEWITAVVCGAIYAGLLVYTRSLGACIVAHGVTNFLLGLWVLVYKDWIFW